MYKILYLCTLLPFNSQRYNIRYRNMEAMSNMIQGIEHISTYIFIYQVYFYKK